MVKIGFRQKLAERQAAIDSLVCVELDPLPEKMLMESVSTVNDWLRVSNRVNNIVDATAPFASMFSFQRANFEAIKHGEQGMRRVIDRIHREYPDIPVFIDCARGGSMHTQAQYAKAHFGLDRADGMSYSPYMGRDSMSALVDPEHPGRGLVSLCYASNPAARDVQDIMTDRGWPYWLYIAHMVLRWAEDLGVADDAGLEMAPVCRKIDGSGEIFSDHLTICRETVGERLWFLIQGIDAQKDSIEETVRAAYRGPGSITMSSSPGTIFAEDPAAAARELRDQIRAAVRSM